LSKNKNVYPDDFKTSVTSNSAVDPATALEAAVVGLELSARDTALRLVRQRQKAARAIIGTQNKMTQAFHRRMPPRVVGKAVSPSLTLGSLAFIPGTKGLQVFNLLNELFRRSSCVLPTEHSYGSVVGNAESGKFVGGGAGAIVVDFIDKVLYHPNEQVKGQIAKLSEPRRCAIGQMGDTTRGILAGGVDSFGILKQDCHVYSHPNDTVSLITSFLQRTRFAPHGGLSSKFAGYTMGGSERAWSGLLVNSIEKMDYTSSLSSSRYITGTSPHAHAVHAAFGNDVVGCLAGGSNSTPVQRKWPSNDITEFPFATETPFLSATKLTNELACSFGAGSSEAGYVFSGWVDTNLTNLTNSGVFKYRYSDKQAFVVETRLLEDAWDRGAVADYGAGFSYA